MSRPVCPICGHPVTAADSTYCTVEDGRIVVYHFVCVMSEEKEKT